MRTCEGSECSKHAGNCVLILTAFKCEWIGKMPRQARVWIVYFQRCVEKKNRPCLAALHLDGDELVAFQMEFVLNAEMSYCKNSNQSDSFSVSLS